MIREIGDGVFLARPMRVKRMVSLRVDESVIDKYDKLTAILRMLDPNINVTRTKIMEIVLERAIRPLLRDPRTLLIIVRNHD